MLVVLTASSLVFYSTLWVGWQGARERGISLGERAESLLP
jgi:hypothetical protein